LGKLVIVPDKLTVMANNLEVAYGNSVPALSATISGYDYEDNADSVFSSSLSFKLVDQYNNEVLLSNTLKPGVYKIVADAAIRQPSNYNVEFVSGTLTISKATLMVKADDKTISEDDCLPKFTSTITGFIDGDPGNIICGPYYTVNPYYIEGNPGTYSIIPYGLKIEHQDYYNIEYVSGTLTVTESDDCDGNPRNGNPGKGNNKNSRTTISASAQKFNKNSLDLKPFSRLTTMENTPGSLIQTSIAYPNPTFGKVIVHVNNLELTDKNILITDILGRIINTGSVIKLAGNNAEIDMSGFKSGVYFITVKADEHLKTFKILKQ
jgi:hypothetical protein